jgi:hypothetical protein
MIRTFFTLPEFALPQILIGFIVLRPPLASPYTRRPRALAGT